PVLHCFLVALAVFGVFVGFASIPFIRRPDQSAVVWYWWLRDIEQGRPESLLPIFTLGARVLSPQDDNRTPVPSHYCTQRPLGVMGKRRNPMKAGTLGKSAFGIVGGFIVLQVFGIGTGAWLLWKGPAIAPAACGISRDLGSQTAGAQSTTSSGA